MVVVAVAVFQEDLDLSSTSTWCVKLYNWQHSQGHPLENGLRDDSNYPRCLQTPQKISTLWKLQLKKKKALHTDSAQVSTEDVGPVVDGFTTAPSLGPVPYPLTHGNPDA